MTNLTLSSDLMISTLLGNDTTPDVLKAVQKRLKLICSPWEKDGCLPSGFVRKNGLGQILGVVEARLGGYGSPHHPHRHGWGYEGMNPRGQGACIGGIVKVDTDQLVLDAPDNMYAIKAREEGAKLIAMKEVDDFLVKEFGLVLLERVL